MKDGGPAFPLIDCNKETCTHESCTGMSLRDWFAFGAMNGDWASQSDDSGIIQIEHPQSALESRARLYYRMADAMLAERNK